jgi:peptide/nickel transport system substrate-binding protein
MKTFRILFSLLVLLGLVLAGCAPQPVEETTMSEAAATEAPAAAATEAPVVAATEAPVVEIGPQVGGNLVWYMGTEPDTLDWQKSALVATYNVDTYLSAALLALCPDNSIVPWLAESYTVSDDGLVYDFILRQDVTFTDGTPLTANEYAWSMNRALAEETQSPVTASNLGTVSSVEAVDDYTLRFTLSSPFAPFLFNMTDPGYMGPLSQAALESLGEDVFSRAPVGVGPYTAAEWVTGEHITLARNPDYNWGPSCYQNTGPYYIENITFRIIPEYATAIAGLQAGELSFAKVDTKDVQGFADAGNFTIFTQQAKGTAPLLSINVSKAPFDDINVRQAVNLAIDRQAIIDVVYLGNAAIQYGPLSPPQIGYWDGASEVGYGYDPERASQLLSDDGYVLNADGIFEKDGQPLTITIQFSSSNENYVKIGQIVQQQLKESGIDVVLEQNEGGLVVDNMINGSYQAAILTITSPEADILYLLFSTLGGLNFAGYVNDPELDALLETSRSETDPAARQEILNQIQQMIIEKAYIVPLIIPQDNYILDSRFEGASFHFYDVLSLADAYYVGE